MGMQVGGAEGGVKSDINVTPMADVMLVLLIIVMIIVPMLQQGVDVRLPLAAHTVEKPETQDQTVLAITADRRYFVNAIQVPANDLRRSIEAALDVTGQRIVIIKADEDVEYAAVMDAMDELRAAGIEDMGLITDPRPGAIQAQGGE